jgi:methenyltetrahydrofolate cyclohydrolase
MDALIGTAIDYLKLAKFSSKQIIENRLLNLESGISKNRMQTQQQLDDYAKMSLKDFASSVASKEPTPGGGSVAAYSGNLAASLVIKVCKLTIGKRGYESSFDRANEILKLAERSRKKLQELANEDSLAYSDVSSALAHPRNTDSERNERKKMLDISLKKATEVPAETMMECVNVFELASETLRIGNRNASSDTETAMELARAAARGALSIVKINLDALSSDGQFVQTVWSKLLKIAEQLNKSTA